MLLLSSKLTIFVFILCLVVCFKPKNALKYHFHTQENIEDNSSTRENMQDNDGMGCENIEAQCNYPNRNQDKSYTPVEDFECKKHFRICNKLYFVKMLPHYSYKRINIF